MADEFDNECPHCDAGINVENEWMHGEYPATSFTFDCPHCGKTIEVDVEFDPVFSVFKPASPQPPTTSPYQA